MNGLLELYVKEKDLNDELQIRYKIEHDKNLKLKEYINGLTIATGIALNGKTVEVTKKTLHELENTMKIEQLYIPETDSYEYRVI